jgi:hypothetical protein
MICSIMEAASVSSVSFSSSVGVLKVRRVDAQRFLSKRYLRRAFAASAARGNSRQTDSRETFGQANRVFVPCDFSFVCHRKATVHMFHRCSSLRRFSVAAEVP